MNVFFISILTGILSGGLVSIAMYAYSEHKEKENNNKICDSNIKYTEKMLNDMKYQEALGVIPVVRINCKNTNNSREARINKIEGICYSKIGHKYNNEEFLMKSLSSLNRAYEYYNKEKNETTSSIIARHIADVYSKLGDFRDPIVNLNNSIDYYKKTIYLKSTNFEEYFLSMGNLTSAYNKLYIKSLKKQYLEKSEDINEEILELLNDVNTDINDKNQKKIYVYFNLGTLYRDYGFITKDINKKIKHYDKSIEYYKNGINLFSIELNPILYSNFQSSMGLSYYNKAQIIKDSALLKDGITYLNNALKIRRKNLQPIEYSATINNLGNAYTELSNYENKKKNLLNAIDCYNESLDIRSPLQMPLLWAETLHNKGISLAKLAEIENIKDNLNDSMHHFKDSLLIYTKDKYPERYAITQFYLGRIYYSLYKCNNSIDAKEFANIHLSESRKYMGDKFFLSESLDNMLKEVN